MVLEMTCQESRPTALVKCLLRTSYGPFYNHVSIVILLGMGVARGGSGQAAGDKIMSNL